MARSLLAAGAKADVMAHTGLTPWMSAFANKHDAVIKALDQAATLHDTSVYLTGALPLPLENARPFESFLLGEYEFERTIGGGELAASRIPLKEREEQQIEAQQHSTGEEKSEAWRVARLALEVPTPVYLKRGSKDLRLWFDPSLALWLISQIKTPDATAPNMPSRWEERVQFLRAEPASPLALDATLATKWQVRLVAANPPPGGESETWAIAPNLRVTRGDAGAALWEQQRTEQAQPSDSKDPRPSRQTYKSGSHEKRPRDTKAAQVPRKSQEQVHPAITKLAKETEDRIRAQSANDPNVRGAIDNLSERRAARAAHEQQRAEEDRQRAKLQAIFSQPKKKPMRAERKKDEL